MACRSKERATEAIEQINTTLGKKSCVEFIRLDLNDLDSVRDFAQEASNKFPTIDILLNNAGISSLPTREVTKQGYEKQFGVNHLGHFLLTNLLLPNIKAATPNGRIINVSSRSHTRTTSNGLILDDLNSEKNY